MYFKFAVTKAVQGRRSTYVTSLLSNSIKQTTSRSFSSHSNMSDNDPQVLEKEKQKSLSKKDREWNEKLASLSEAVVKADKEQDKPIKDLQSETVEQLDKREKEEE